MVQFFPIQQTKTEMHMDQIICQSQHLLLPYMKLVTVCSKVDHLHELVHLISTYNLFETCLV